MIYNVDLHVHIGRTKSGKPVKITASNKLTPINILEQCFIKGIDIVGLVDCAVPEILDELNSMMNKDVLIPLHGGGLRYKNRITLLLASEVEIGGEKKGSPHILCFLRDIKSMRKFSNILSNHIKNINLSSQRCSLSSIEIYKIVKDLGGFLIPAHVFTPFKSYYGSSTERLGDIFKEYYNDLNSIELGLSSDTDLADEISELKSKTFLSNSDAHSLNKIAREFNVFEMQEPDFNEVFSVLNREDGKKIIKNYGLNPELGKYHRTFCLDCGNVSTEVPPVYSCTNCGSKNIVFGVKDRIAEIKDQDIIHPKFRPEYVYQIPLEFIPKIGYKTIKKLVNEFGTEIYALHRASYHDLEKVVGSKAAENIFKIRQGNFTLRIGGGGFYGKII
ncbi:MAG: endonuclease Q family protein [Thermoanaerobacteraceae bacterium]|nr:endonuclease Q family protein [Thermoanaerobacteraceae bacterium]